MNSEAERHITLSYRDGLKLLNQPQCLLRPGPYITIERIRGPEDGVIKLDGGFNGFPRALIGGLGNVQCCNHGRHKEPDGGLSDMRTRASSSTKSEYIVTGVPKFQRGGIYLLQVALRREDRRIREDFFVA